LVLSRRICSCVVPILFSAPTFPRKWLIAPLVDDGLPQALVSLLSPLRSVVPELLLALGQGGMTPVWVALAYLGVQTMEGHVLLAMIMARGMKVHPLALIFSVLLCVAAFGVLGVLVEASGDCGHPA
jgi:hypothetical protein